MGKFAGLILSIALITACGQIAKETALPDDSETNLFELESNAGSVVHNNSLVGLWESSAYSDGQVLKQIRWRVSDGLMTLAKKCTTIEGQSVFAQVSALVEINDDGEIDEFGFASPNAIRFEDSELPEPVRVPIDDFTECSVQINAPLGDGEVHLRDAEFSFSAHIVNGQIDMTIFADPSVPAPALRKISDH